MNAPTDPRLVLREDELDGGLELLLLAEAALWSAVDAALEGESRAAGETKIGRSHWRAALLLRRRPGAGVQDLAGLTGLTKQAASKTAADLIRLGLVEPMADEDLDGRRRPLALTDAGRAFEGRISERLRALVARAYRTGGLDGVAGMRRILSALAGPRLGVGPKARAFSDEVDAGSSQKTPYPLRKS
jgi:DNA-binding MarR family transcriptional regulator